MVLEISHNLFINAHKVKKLLKAFIGNACSNKTQNLVMLQMSSALKTAKFDIMNNNKKV